MSFVSYAQNYEDVILWRALGDVERGFYVDVGAADPEEDSVTNAFYERGWSGINIEPVDEYFRKLATGETARYQRARRGRSGGGITRYCILSPAPGSPLWIRRPPQRHQAAGRQACETLVPVLTLKAILEHCAPPTIHFLKIDVEGAEVEVLKGLDLNAVRPWVIIVEATAPNSQISTREEWENLIVGYGYDFAYFDGLNCFYVAKEFASLKEKLSVPPNFFDDFVRFKEVAVRQRAANLECEVADLRGQAAQTANLRNALHVAQEQTSSLRNAVHLAEEQAAKLRGALDAKQAQNNNLQAQNDNLQARLDHLSGRIHQLEAQLAVPSVDRAIGRALQTSSRNWRPDHRWRLAQSGKTCAGWHGSAIDARSTATGFGQNYTKSISEGHHSALRTRDAYEEQEATRRVSAGADSGGPAAYSCGSCRGASRSLGLRPFDLFETEGCHVQQ